jgi:hypothetical protein
VTRSLEPQEPFELAGKQNKAAAARSKNMLHYHSHPAFVEAAIGKTPAKQFFCGSLYLARTLGHGCTPLCCLP